MGDIKQLLGFPFREREWIMKMIVGSVIILVPIVNFLSLGYFLRCINYGSRAIRELPDWCHLGEMFRDGCMALLIALVYIIVPLALVVLLMMINTIAGLIFAVLLIIIVTMFIPMAIASYALHNNIRDAFRLTEIFRQIDHANSIYLLAYLCAVLGVIIGTLLLISIPVLGFLGGFIIFYCGVVFFTLLGLLYLQGC